MMNSWDKLKNNENPENIKQNSKDKYWWSCSDCNYSWLATPNSRRNAKSNCPRCAIKKRDQIRSLSSGSLREYYPDIAKEWDESNNEKLIVNISSYSRYTANWICSVCENKWASRVDHRTKMGSGCPECSKTKRLITFNKNLLANRNSLENSYPEVAKEWHPYLNFPLTPSNILPKSTKKTWWQCDKGHAWQATPSNRTSGGTRCPFCNSQTSELEIRFYSELDKLLGNGLWRSKIEGVEIDVLFPDHKLGLEIDGYPWHVGKEDKDIRKTELLKKIGYNLIHIRHEYLKPLFKEDIIFYNGKPYKDALIRTVTRLVELNYLNNDIKEYYLKNAFINQDKFDEIMSWVSGAIPGTSLAELFPELVKEWIIDKNLPISPEKITAGSNKIVWWICKNGHEWQASISNRVKGSGCAACSKKISSAEYNLQNTNSDLLQYWDYSKNDISPSELTPKSNKKIWWKCHRSHSFLMSLKDFSRKNNCPICSGKRVTQDNCLEVKLPDLALFWDFEKNAENSPKTVTSSSGKIFWWRCPNCDFSWNQSPNSITRRPSLNYCPSCRKKN